jgi:hypothetical protein
LKVGPRGACPGSANALNQTRGHPDDLGARQSPEPPGTDRVPWASRAVDPGLVTCPPQPGVGGRSTCVYVGEGGRLCG